MVLHGHSLPLQSITLVPFTPERLVSCDRGGNLMMWNISQRGAKMYVEPLQTFISLTDTNRRFVPRFVAPLGPQLSIVGASMGMHTFQAKPVLLSNLPSAVLYNSTLLLFYTAVGKVVRIFDATTGLLQNTYTVTDGDVVSMVCDDRERKLIVADDRGNITVINLANGVIMKQEDAHGDEKLRSIAYCGEDKCVVSLTAESTLRVYDELDAEEIPLLRTVEKTHRREARVCAFSCVVCDCFPSDLARARGAARARAIAAPSRAQGDVPLMHWAWERAQVPSVDDCDRWIRLRHPHLGLSIGQARRHPGGTLGGSLRPCIRATLPSHGFCRHGGDRALLAGAGRQRRASARRAPLLPAGQPIARERRPHHRAIGRSQPKPPFDPVGQRASWIAGHRRNPQVQWRTARRNRGERRGAPFHGG